VLYDTNQQHNIRRRKVMAMDFRTTEVVFKEAKRDDNTEKGMVTFDSRVRKADAAIKAYQLGYTEGDHELLLQKVQVWDVKEQGDDVHFQVTIGLRDDSGNYDDPYEGKVSVLVIADTVEGGD
jgi:hypothetical protein